MPQHKSYKVAKMVKYVSLLAINKKDSLLGCLYTSIIR
ncbi:hypothetical protein NU09_2179 [Flavobacterium beibuense]|uniref:Uncharacterized protein n=1 Tax=Flavobacterium beibuense TaxID=657326 RepID=A0A444W9C7_9FLAO|nr:hypothetical protein NU09_2179 [Flavobacterium beibuense]